MLSNNAASALIGLIPFAGDVALAAFKANSRNAALLEEFLRIRGEEFLKVQAEKEGKRKRKDPPSRHRPTWSRSNPALGRRPGRWSPARRARSAVSLNG
ncbi:hypothetical protein B0H14DRAFT_2970465 [Mycena olivaceomarginata]|nr:hypothetical protein B0H14DRAFT_2970465 [Mycena olivaceomarginata]